MHEKREACAGRHASSMHLRCPQVAHPGLVQQRSTSPRPPPPHITPSPHRRAMAPPAAAAAAAAAATTTTPAVDIEDKAVRVRQLEQEADAQHKLAQRLNKEGRFLEAQEAYGRMHALEDEASELAKEVGCVACVLGDPSCGSAGDALSADEQRDFFQLIPVPGWGSSSTGAGAFRARARGAVVGSLVADAAAMGVHWVYDLDVLQALADERSASHRQASTSTSTSTPEVGLEFTDPPRSPFYRYASGRNSPYGEQTLVLLHSLAARGGLDCVAYANAFAAHFAEGAFDGYRDVSTKGFLRNFQRGLAPPQTGVADAQANCVARAAPLVLAFAAPADPAPGLDAAGAAGGGRVEGQVRLGRAVRAATRVTQNSEAAGAWGAAGAEVLARVVRDGAAPSAAVRWVASQLEQQIAASRPPDVTDGADGAAPAPPASSDASQQQQQQQQAVESKVELAALVAGHLRQVLALAALPVPEATAKLGRNCHMPAALCTPLHVVLHMEHLAREERRARRGGGVGGSGDSRGQAEGEEEAEEEWDDGLAAAVGARFAQGIRAAIREGGCCASRASYAGALLGALGGEEGGVPAAWRARCTELPRIVEAVDAICLARDRA